MSRSSSRICRSGRADLAGSDWYLESTGDYDGLRVLRVYLVYRAMVRAKVARFRMGQLESPAEREQPQAEYRAFMDLARRQTQRPPIALIITHGLAGSGKTTCAERVLEQTGAVRIRTDVERKRLHGLGAGASSGSPVGEGLYSAEATHQTYSHCCLPAGRRCRIRRVVDGAFLRRWPRNMFREAAEALGVAFVILAVSAAEATLRDRIARRRQRGGDASEATIEVLDAQLRAEEPPDADEQPLVVRWDAGDSDMPKRPAAPIIEAWQHHARPLDCAARTIEPSS